MKIILIKTKNILTPADPQQEELLRKIKSGQAVTVELKSMRNYQFHKKLFAMLNVGFDAWEPEQKEYQGMPVQKNFDAFRKICTIAAGYYTASYDLDGDVTLEAKSIAYANMEDDEFEKLYNDIANVLLQKVLRNYTKPDLDRVVDELMHF